MAALPFTQARESARDAVAVRGFDVRTRADQAIGQIADRPAGRPNEGGGAVGLGRIHIGFLLEGELKPLPDRHS